MAHFFILFYSIDSPLSHSANPSNMKTSSETTIKSSLSTYSISWVPTANYPITSAINQTQQAVSVVVTEVRKWQGKAGGSWKLTRVDKISIVSLVTDQDARACGAFHAAQVRKTLWTIGETNAVPQELWSIALNWNRLRRVVTRLAALWKMLGKQ